MNCRYVLLDTPYQTYIHLSRLSSHFHMHLKSSSWQESSCSYPSLIHMQTSHLQSRRAAYKKTPKCPTTYHCHQLIGGPEVSHTSWVFSLKLSPTPSPCAKPWVVLPLHPEPAEDLCESSPSTSVVVCVAKAPRSQFD